MIRIVLTTTDSADDARRLARSLVSEKLAACVNIIPNVTSVYKWEGRLEEAAEFLLFIKTAQDRVPTLIGRLKELHLYDLPEVVVIDVEKGLPEYLNWVVASCQENS